MRRAILLVLCLAACTRRPGTQAPVPDAPPASLALIAPHLERGEEMAWDVFWQGMQVGHAELVTGAGEIRTSFRTGTLASALSSVRYDLSTVIDHERALSTTEILTRSGTPRRVDVDLGARRTPDGHPLHTLTSALAVLRTWSQATGPQGYLWLVHGGELYRLDVFPPVRDEALGKKALRIDAVVRALDRSVTLDVSIWLARTANRTPLRFVVEEGGDRVSAELVESTAPWE